MKEIQFHKYQGTGNDFVMIDNRKNVFNGEDHALIRKLCDRKFGIGADGLILIQHHPDCDFEMVYYNADASQSMCGNGSRCAVQFAYQLKIIGKTCTFLAIDGLHEASIEGGLINLKMGDVKQVKKIEDDFFINTGSPHHIRFVDSLENFPVYEEGRSIRNSPSYISEGTNVNFVALKEQNEIFVRTFERGVENETLSCGTGVTACSLAASFKNYSSPVKVQTLGGFLEVSFLEDENHGYTNIYLTGPAEEVFKGTINVKNQDVC